MNMEIGHRIKRLREARGMTQVELAKKIPMDQGQYSRLEKNKFDPSISTLEKVAKALNTKVFNLFVDELLSDSDSANKSVLEKIQLLENLEDEDRKSIYKIIDGLSSKTKMKATIANLLE